MAKVDTVSDKVEQVRPDIESQAARAQQSAHNWLSEIEARVRQSPFGAVAIAGGLGFFLSRIRADRVAMQAGAVPFLLGALSDYMVNRHS